MPLSLIRIATDSDAQTIALIHIKSWQKAYEPYIPEEILSNLSLPERTAQWYQLLHKDVVVLILEMKGQAIGFASICEFRDEIGGKLSGEISAIYLNPDYWRQGLGTQLCMAALEKLRDMGYQEVLLWVLADNHQARTFYEKIGFETTKQTKLEEFYEGGALLREILYKKEL